MQGVHSGLKGLCPEATVAVVTRTPRRGLETEQQREQEQERQQEAGDLGFQVLSLAVLDCYPVSLPELLGSPTLNFSREPQTLGCNDELSGRRGGPARAGDSDRKVRGPYARGSVAVGGGGRMTRHLTYPQALSRS